MRKPGKQPDPFYSSSQWRKVRLLALKRDCYRCVICSRDVSAHGQSRVDHIVPRSTVEKGVAIGKQMELSLQNLRTLCPQCDLRHDAARPGSATRKVKPLIGLDGLPDDWK